MENCGESTESGRPLGTGRKGRSPDLRVKVQYVTVDGEAGKAIAARQSQAILALLRWAADHRDEAYGYNQQ